MFFSKGDLYIVRPNGYTTRGGRVSHVDIFHMKKATQEKPDTKDRFCFDPDKEYSILFLESATSEPHDFTNVLVASQDGTKMKSGYVVNHFLDDICYGCTKKIKKFP